MSCLYMYTPRHVYCGFINTASKLTLQSFSFQYSQRQIAFLSCPFLCLVLVCYVMSRLVLSALSCPFFSLPHCVIYASQNRNEPWTEPKIHEKTSTTEVIRSFNKTFKHIQTDSNRTETEYCTYREYLQERCKVQIPGSWPAPTRSEALLRINSQPHRATTFL